jgi:hypothetical protein
MEEIFKAELKKNPCKRKTIKTVHCFQILEFQIKRYVNMLEAHIFEINGHGL